MIIYKNAKLDKKILIDWKKSWYMWGSIGVGKTHNAYAFVMATNEKTRELQKKNEVKHIWQGYYYLEFINFAEICNKLRNMPMDSFDGLVKTRTQQEERIIRGKFLIIDDLAAEKRSDYTHDLLMRLVEHRYSNALYTGFTSNLSMGKLPYDARIISRVAGIVGKNKFEIIGKDRRITQE